MAGEFRLDDEEAEQILKEVGEATSSWRQVAATQGLSSGAIKAMAPAFEHEESGAVEKLART